MRLVQRREFAMLDQGAHIVLAEPCANKATILQIGV
jgi:hypothetical protein